MKKILLAIVILIAFANTYAQEIKVNWGTEYKNPKKETIGNVIYFDGKNIFATLTASHGGGTFSKATVTPTIVKFDDEMQPVKRRDYTTSEDNLYFHGTYHIAGKFFMVTSKFDKRSNTREFYAQKFNKELEPDGQSSLLWKIVGQKGEDVGFAFRFSEDSSKFVIAAIAQQKKHEKKNIAFNVFDGDLKSVFEKEVEFPYNEENMRFTRLELTNTNDIYLLCKVYNQGKDNMTEEMKSPEGKGKVPSYMVVLEKYSPNNNDKEIVIDLDNRWFNHGYIQSDRDGNLLFFAAYSDKFDNTNGANVNGINGVVFFKIDSKTGAIISHSTMDIKEDFANRIHKIQEDKSTCSSKQPAIAPNFIITDFQVMPDQSVYVILEAENSFLAESNGMIVFRIDSKGDFTWNKFIPKKQTNLYYYLTSHATMFCNDKVYIFYNDEKKNADYDVENAIKSPRTFSATKKMNLMMLEIDKNGNMKNSVFADTEVLGTTIDMNLTKQISDNKLMLCGYKYSNDDVKLGTVSFGK